MLLLSVPQSKVLVFINYTQLKKARKEGRLSEALLDRRSKLKRLVNYRPQKCLIPHNVVVIVSAEILYYIPLAVFLNAPCYNAMIEYMIQAFGSTVSGFCCLHLCFCFRFNCGFFIFLYRLLLSHFLRFFLLLFMKSI